MIFYIEHAGYYETHSTEAPTEADHYAMRRQVLKKHVTSLMLTNRVDREVVRKALARVGAKNLAEVQDEDLLHLERVFEGVVLALGLNDE